jgi:hypothetical protein
MEGNVILCDGQWFVKFEQNFQENIIPVRREDFHICESEICWENQCHVEFEIGDEYHEQSLYPQYAKLKAPLLDENDQDTSVYSEVELAIIRWNIDGTKTAGELTRTILKIIGK